MALSFSQRMGMKPIRETLQIENIDEPLRNRLWSVLRDDFFDIVATTTRRGDHYVKGDFFYVSEYLWIEFFAEPSDTNPTRIYNDPTKGKNAFLDHLRRWYFSATWHEIYSIIEKIACIEGRLVKNFIKECNAALEQEMSGYRIVNTLVTPITSEAEIKEIEEAIKNTDKHTSVNKHLKTALEFFSDRKTPDYRNSIKESISAVESYCCIIVGKKNATLGDAIGVAEKLFNIHPAMKKAFACLYGYTSDSGGIRHALTEDDVVPDFEDAKFMLVSCSAFINYLKAKVAKMEK